MTEPVQKRADDGGVKWLLGGLLLRKLVSIAKSLLANELDLRDWMAPNTAPSYRREELWFDFMADIGDDPHVMARVAAASNQSYAANELHRPVDEAPPSLQHGELPRGAFLLLGGDTAYVTPDEPTLRYRVVEPFEVAYVACKTPPTRPIYAIPGNHDYYDGLVGFNRMFRAPCQAPDSRCVLPVAGHVATQESSYTRLLLPGDWELWAADIGPHGLDFRQREHFRPGGVRAPNKLILCTHSPPIANDRIAVAGLEKVAYERLLGVSEVSFTPNALVPADNGVCRLFLAGHVHHYARYDGQRDAGRAPTHTATVVAGAGGSFVHPTEHGCGEIPAATKYPDPQSSRELTAAAVTAPWKIMDGGYLWMVGALLAVLFQWTWPSAGTPLRGPIAWTITVASCLGVVVLGVAVMSSLVNRRVSTAKYARASQQTSEHHNGRRLASAIVPICVGIALVIPFISHQLVPEMDPLASASVWLTLATALVLGLGTVGATAGGSSFNVGLALLGAGHGAMQLVLPHLIVRSGPAAVVATTVVWLALGWIGRSLYRARQRMLLIAWWLLQGAGIACALYFLRWPTLDLGMGVWPLAAVAGIVAISFQFGNYLLLASAWGAHCNEAGITARSRRFKQWIRFHVTPDRLTGYVIGHDLPDAAPRLVDVFTIAPASGR